MKNDSTLQMRLFFRITAPLFLEIQLVFLRKIGLFCEKNSLLVILLFFKQVLRSNHFSDMIEKRNFPEKVPFFEQFTKNLQLNTAFPIDLIVDYNVII